MPFPNNAVEETLVAAKAGKVTSERLLDSLADADLWMPLPKGAVDLQGELPIVIIDDTGYVAVYTSEEQFKQGAGNMSYAVAPGRAFVQTLPPELGLAVNPDGAGGLPIPPDVLQAIRGEAAANNTRVMLCEPIEEPHALLDALSTAFAAAAPEVVTARRAWGKFGDNPEGLLLGIETTPDDERSQRSVLDAIATALARAPVQFNVDSVFLEKHDDPLSGWLRENIQPFYVRRSGSPS